jgi:hypothetical protein
MRREMGRICNTHGDAKGCFQSNSQKAWKEEREYLIILDMDGRLTLKMVSWGCVLYAPSSLGFSSDLFRHANERLVSWEGTSYLRPADRMPASQETKCVMKLFAYRARRWTSSYSTGLAFKSRPGDSLSWLMFLVVFLRTCRQTPGSYIKLDHDCFLLCPFQFSTH